LVMKGDYLAIANVLSTVDLGFYYFGFQLVSTISVVATQGLIMVILPVFVRIRSDNKRMRKAFVESIETLALVCFAGSGLLIVAGAEVVHVLWGGKWDGAVYVVVGIAVTISPKVVGFVGINVLEAYGRWGKRSAMIIVDGVALVFCAAVGARAFGLEGAVIGVVLQRIGFGLALCVIGGRLIGVSSGQIISVLFRSAVPSCMAIVIVVGVKQWAGNHGFFSAQDLMGHLQRCAGISVFYLALLTALNLILARMLVVRVLSRVSGGRIGLLCGNV